MEDQPASTAPNYIKPCKLFTTASLFLLNFAKGLVFSTPGPTLLSLTEIAQTNIERISWIFFFRGCGSVIGSVIGGWASRYRTITFAVAITVSNATFVGIPWCTNVLYMYGLNIVQGMTYGCVSSTMNYFTLQLWQEDSPPIFSASIACFLAGACVGPLVAIPFLPTLKHDVLYAHPNSTIRNDSVESSHPHTPVSVSTAGYSHSANRGTSYHHQNFTLRSVQRFQDVTSNDSIFETTDFRGKAPSNNFDAGPIRDLYLVIMMCGMFAGVLVTLGSAGSSHVGLAVKELSESRKVEPVVNGGKTRIFLIIFCLMYQVLLIGLEIMFIGLLPSYMVEGLGCSPRDGTQIASLFWGAYTIVAMGGVLMSHYLTPSTILLFDNIFLSAGAAILFCGYQNSTMVWLGTTVLAVGYGPAYATIFLWGDDYISLSRKLTGVFVAAPELGGVIMPVIGGRFFSDFPGSMMIMTFILTILCDAMFILTELTALPFRRKANMAVFGLRRRTQEYESFE